MTETSSPTRVDIDVRRMPWIRRLAGEYADRFPAVAEFFAGNPWTDSGWGDAIRRVQAYQRDRSALVEMLRTQAARRGAPPNSLQAIDSLADPRSVAVVTGQQAGLFGRFCRGE